MQVLDSIGAAAFLRMKKNTLYKKTSNREIPFFKKGGRIYFDKKKLVQWIEKGEVLTKMEIAAEAERLLLIKQKRERNRETFDIPKSFTK